MTQAGTENVSSYACVSKLYVRGFFFRNRQVSGDRFACVDNIRTGAHMYYVVART